MRKTKEKRLLLFSDVFQEPRKINEKQYNPPHPYGRNNSPQKQDVPNLSKNFV